MSDIESDMAAAKLLGVSTKHSGFAAKYCWNEAKGVYTGCKRHCDRCKEWFDLPNSNGHPEFIEECQIPPISLSDGATRDTIVQVLGIEYCVDIMVYHMPEGVRWKARYSMERLSHLCESYEEAIRVAVIEVMK